MNKKARTSPPLDTSSGDFSKSLEYFNSSWVRPAPSLLHMPPEVRHMIYDHVYGTRRAISYAHDCHTVPETWMEVEAADADEGELERLRSPYPITGLHHTCRQLRRETVDFNPLFKNVEGDSASLLRLLGKPNPLQRLRAVTICLRPGDTDFVDGMFTLSRDFRWLVCRLSRMKQLVRLNVEGCISLFDPEEHAAFAAIWSVLCRRILICGDLDVVFTASKYFGKCDCCGMAICRCLVVSSWAQHVTMVTRQV